MRSYISFLLILLLAACVPTFPAAEQPTSPPPSPTQARMNGSETPTASAVDTTAAPKPFTATPLPTPTQAFGASEDPLIFATPEGQVMRLNLASGEQVPLSEPGIYQPGDLLQPYAAGQIPAQWTPALSPDQRFLALPDPAGSGTWLIDLSGLEPSRRLFEIPAVVSWSPDGASIAWINDKTLSILEISSGRSLPLAEIDGMINAAWSPRGDSIAVATGVPGDAEITLALVDAQSGAVHELTSARPVTAIGGGFDLTWTEDGGEIWYSPAMIAYAVEVESVYPLLSPFVFAGERQTMYAFSAAPDRKHFAYRSEEQDRSGKALQIMDEMPYGNRMEIAFDIAWSACAWTAEGNNLIVQEGAGDQARLWRINAGFTAPAYYISAADAGEILAPGALIGTVSHLAQYHRQVAPRVTPTRVEPPAPEYADDWGATPMAEARLAVEHPFYWNFNWPGMGDVATTVSNFEIVSGLDLLSLRPEWFYAHFDSFAPEQDTPRAFLEEAVFSPQANAEWQPVTIDGRAGYRVRWKDRPTHEEVYVPFEDNTIIRIQKYPLHSEYDADFERMLGTIRWLPEDQWAARYYPTETPDPIRSAAPALRQVGTLPALHWREGLALVAFTSRGEIARASTTRLTFYNPATLEVTRTGLVTLPADLMLTTLSGDGDRMARAAGNTVEILDLIGLNEQGDPPVLASFQAARREVVRVAYSPDGQTLAVISQGSRDDIGPAVLEVFDTRQARPFGSWDIPYSPDLSFSPDSRWLATWIRVGTARITYYAIDPAAGSASENSIDRREVWDAAAFSGNSQLLAAAAASGPVVFWRFPDGGLVKSWNIHPTCCVVSSLSVDPGSRYLAMAGPDGVELRRMVDGSLAGYANQQVYWTTFVEQEERLFLAGMDGNGAVIIWEID